MKQQERLKSVALPLAVIMLTVVAIPASANGNTQISGRGEFDVLSMKCGGPPDGYESFISYPPILLEGDLEGCLYTKVSPNSMKFGPSGVYEERGSEVIVACLYVDDEEYCGLLETTYHFTAKFDEGGNQVYGRCQHPIVWGDEGFEDATGRLDFRDNVDVGDFDYRGHLKLANER